jgi:hypothetical protein
MVELSPTLGDGERHAIGVILGHASWKTTQRQAAPAATIAAIDMIPAVETDLADASAA